MCGSKNNRRYGLQNQLKLKNVNNFLKNLKHNYWYSEDKKLTFHFETIKGLPVVTVTEGGCFRSKERSYILTATSSDKVATFNGTNGPVTIGITESGDELFVTPQGVFLMDYYSTEKKNEDAKSINHETTVKISF